MLKKIALVILAITLLVTTVLVSGCSEGTSSEKQRENSIVTRAQMFEKAEALYPVPQTNNFPAREMLVKYTERQDLVNHPYYVYVLADTGNIIGYYVAQSYPVSINAFLSSTEDVYLPGNGTSLTLTAPSLDGIYYGGSGASSGDGWFFFDAETDALIVLYGVKLFVADQPLRIEAKPITVEQK